MLRKESIALRKVGYAVLRTRVDRYGNTALEGFVHGEKKLETPRCARDARRRMESFSREESIAFPESWLRYAPQAPRG